jgi:hypothetical protein
MYAQHGCLSLVCSSVSLFNPLSQLCRFKRRFAGLGSLSTIETISSQREAAAAAAAKE